MITSIKLNRFTTLQFLIELLLTNKLVLLSPKTWEDHNDKDILLAYKEKEKAQGLLVLCFSDCSETVHHWKAFSNGECGCCIEFDKNKLLQHLSNKYRIEHKKVNYPTIINSSTVNNHDILFTKRFPYKCEEEYRIIMKHEEDILSFPAQIELHFINKITLSPNLPKSTFDSLKSALSNLLNHNSIPINHSTLYENSEWIDGFKKRTSL